MGWEPTSNMEWLGREKGDQGPTSPGGGGKPKSGRQLLGDKIYSNGFEKAAEARRKFEREKIVGFRGGNRRRPVPGPRCRAARRRSGASPPLAAPLRQRRARSGVKGAEQFIHWDGCLPPQGGAPVVVAGPGDQVRVVDGRGWGLSKRTQPPPPPPPKILHRVRKARGRNNMKSRMPR